MRHLTRTAIVLFALTYPSLPKQANPDTDQPILQSREAVWRAWFADDEATLKALVPPETIVISAGEEHWKTQAEVFAQAREFHQSGGKLIQLRFPRSLVQHFGDVAFVYSEYFLEVSENGKSSVTRGRATEVFVLRNGVWVNPGWHTDSN